VDAVELDGTLTALGRRYFELRGPDLHTYTADARPWLEQSKARYDAIFLDAYRQPYIPFYLVTREFFALVRAHLRPGGVVIVNVVSSFERAQEAPGGLNSDVRLHDEKSPAQAAVRREL